MAVKKIPYSRKELLKPGGPITYKHHRLNQIAFPLGGLGTGCFSVSGIGSLIDWEIFNRPNKGYRPGYTFFSLWAREGRKDPVFRVLERRILPPYNGERENLFASGPSQQYVAGLPRLEDCTFTGAFPFGKIDFADGDLPLKVSMEFFNPFIPLNDRDSSLPVGVFLITLRNPGRGKVSATLALSMQNRSGHPEVTRTRNTLVREKGLSAIFMNQEHYPEDSPRFGTMALATPAEKITWQCNWRRGAWFDSLHHFCNTFGASGKFDNDNGLDPVDRGSEIGSVGVPVTLKGGESVRIPFVIAWHFPWHEMYWDRQFGSEEGRQNPTAQWKNYYATVHKDALEAARYTVQNLPRLEGETRAFQEALFHSTMPECVLDAVSSQISILKSPTCIRVEDGTFWAWEGCTPNSGCCHGTCTHVWNYAQALPYLFPALERSIRNSHFDQDLREEDGHMNFRMPLPLGRKADHGFHAAADGQLGDILKIYREWLICGDDAWLRRLWPRVRKALEYAWVGWDPEKNGLIVETHHNTYDIEFHGAEPLAQFFYLGALRAAEEMARYLGESEQAEEYRKIFESGRKKTEKELWNKDYFVQRIPGEKDTRFQYGKGCLSDQMIGQWFGAMLGLGEFVDGRKVRKALGSVFKYNWMSDLSRHMNPQRVYALNNEAGLLLASWPRGGRPEFPFVYSDEVWPGIEYQVASHLIYEGLVEEGLAVVKGVRDRHDGYVRNPWNEFECGNHYARSMASYAVLTALAGFQYSAPEKRIGFSPRLDPRNFRSFFSVEAGWGLFSLHSRRKGFEATLEVSGGNLKLNQIEIGNLPGRIDGSRVEVRAGGKKVKARVTVKSGKLTARFEETVSVVPGSPLTLKA